MPVVGGKGGGAAAAAEGVRRSRANSSSSGATSFSGKRREFHRQRTRVLQQHRSKMEQDIETRKATALGRLSLRLRQPQVRLAYLDPAVQWAIAACIVGNFCTNIFEKQVDPRGTNTPGRWFAIETAWNCVFIFELLWNMWGCFYLTQWQGHFFSSGYDLV
jgi:hypothetical protein